MHTAEVINLADARLDRETLPPSILRHLLQARAYGALAALDLCDGNHTSARFHHRKAEAALAEYEKQRIAFESDCNFLRAQKAIAQRMARRAEQLVTKTCSPFHEEKVTILAFDETISEQGGAA